ncbi:hypothetical protein ACA910_008941 [Epithemia clementina (nom. ined.)]
MTSIPSRRNSTKTTFQPATMKGMRVPKSLQALFIHNSVNEDSIDDHENNDMKNDEVCSSSTTQNAPQEKSPRRSTTSQSYRYTEWRDSCTVQEYFDALLEERGYVNVPTYDTLSTGYYHRPSELQLASYGPKLLQIVKSNDVTGLREVLTVAGLSPNPCNAYGESLVHMACRRGHASLLELMVQAGAALETSDDYGRTPLHDACWASQPAFEIVKRLVLQCDRCLWFLKDCRGALPLSYVHKDHFGAWKDWLDAHMDIMFPRCQSHSVQEQLLLQLDNWLLAMPPVSLSSISSHSKPFPAASADRNVNHFVLKMEPLSLELIQMVARGALSPREARVIVEIANRGDDEVTVADTVTTDGDDFYDSDDNDDDFSNYSSDNDDDYYDDYDHKNDELSSLEGELVQFMSLSPNS